MSVSNPRGFLEGLSSSFFDVAQMTSIDVYSKNVGDLTLRDDLAVQIIRARFVGCRLSGLPNGLGACRNIVSLDLTENNIETLPNDALSPFLSLENLDLTANLIRSIDFEIPDTLQTLVLSFNPQLDVQSLWKKAMPNLKQLKLTHCKISDLPEEVPPWAATLELLALDGNELRRVPAVLKKFPALTDLSLHGNLIESVDGGDLPESLKTLNVAFNEIGEWGELKHENLALLILQSNLIRAFPEHVFGIEKLRTLLLSKCSIEGVIDVEVPESVAGIDLAWNNIEGFSERFIRSLKTVSGFNFS